MKSVVLSAFTDKETELGDHNPKSVWDPELSLHMTLPSPVPTLGISSTLCLSWACASLPPAGQDCALLSSSSRHWQCMVLAQGVITDLDWPQSLWEPPTLWGSCSGWTPCSWCCWVKSGAFHSTKNRNGHSEEVKKQPFQKAKPNLLPCCISPSPVCFSLFSVSFFSFNKLYLEKKLDSYEIHNSLYTPY